MVFSIKEDKDFLKNEICKAMINMTDCLAFVAMQENTHKTEREFKKLDEYCDKLKNLWDYLDFCIEKDLDVDISKFSYNLILSLPSVDVEDYKLYYRNYRDFWHYL